MSQRIHVLIAVGIVAVAITAVPEGSLAQSVNVRLVEPKDSNLPNLIRINDQLLCGGQPDGAAAFEHLQQMGVKTIISVDGAKPDVALAAKYQLRYVHLPHGYDGIPDPHQTLLAQAVYQLEKPIYMHCHHGKHRSPTAAAVVSVCLGWMNPAAAKSILEIAQTEKRYVGLFRSVEYAKPLPVEQLNMVGAEFPEVAKLPMIVTAMVEVDDLFGRLETYQKQNWQLEGKALAEAQQSATLLLEQFKELSRIEVPRPTQDFMVYTRQSQHAAGTIEQVLAQFKQLPDDLVVLNKALDTLQDNCLRCHQSYRN